MFISRKKYKELCERVRKLEDRTYDLEINGKANLFGYGRVNFREFCRIFPKIIDDRISKKTAAGEKPTAEKD